LGPLLTLIVYKKSKPSLKSDLTIIGIFQITCLSAGVWFVHFERPILQVLTLDKISVITYDEAKSAAPGSILPKNAFALAKPKQVYMNLPNDFAKVQEVEVMTNVVDGIRLSLREDLYKDFGTESSKNDLEWRLNRLEYNKQNECYILELSSKHVEDKQACFSLTRGIIKIISPK